MGLRAPGTLSEGFSMPVRANLLVAGLVVLAGGGLPAAPVEGKEAGEKQTREDLAAFKAYLEKNHPGKKWQTGPSRVDTPEVRRAYGKRRFYYVFSSPPLPPGVNLPEAIQAYQRRVKEFQETFIS